MMAAPLEITNDNPIIIALREENERLRGEIEQLWKAFEGHGLDIADHGRRICKIEGVPKASRRAEDYLERIHAHLVKSGQRGITYQDAAKHLGITKRRVQQLKKRFEDDPRFIIVRHPRRTNSHVICLRKVIK